MKNIKKAFAQLKEAEEESDISGSDESDGSEGAAHFQFHDHDRFQFVQKASMFDPRIERLLKQNQGTRPKLDLRDVTLLDSQSTIDQICNKELVKDVSKSSKSMQLKSNGGTTTIHQQARMKGYANHLWFSKKAITNILALSYVIDD
jgi:hypothetical protein